MGSFVVFSLAPYGVVGHLFARWNDDPIFVVETGNYLLSSCKLISSRCVCFLHPGRNVGTTKFSNFGMVERVVIGYRHLSR